MVDVLVAKDVEVDVAVFLLLGFPDVKLALELAALAVRMWWPSGGSVCGYSWQLGVAEGQGDFGAGGGVHAEWVGGRWISWAFLGVSVV